MKFVTVAMAAVVALAAFVALATADCIPDNAAVQTASTSVYVNHRIQFYMCRSLESSCIHPDPQLYPVLFPNATLPWYKVCVSAGQNAGENAITATENGVTCTPVSVPNNATCGSIYTVSSDLAVYLSYYPCNNWWGTVTFACTSYRQGDDWTNGVDPATNPVIGTWTLTAAVTVPSCNATTCVHGSCAFPAGCACSTGWTGDNCDVSGAASLAISMLFILLATMASLVFNL